MAQEESRSISENTTWGQRKRFADGRASVAYKRFLGYDRGPKGGLQKSYTVDFLQKKTKKNEGEIPQYYVEGNHEAIIPPDTFDLVQAEIQKRYSEGKKYSGISIFLSRIKCGAITISTDG